MIGGSGVLGRANGSTYQIQEQFRVFRCFVAVVEGVDDAEAAIESWRGDEAGEGVDFAAARDFGEWGSHD